MDKLRSLSIQGADILSQIRQLHRLLEVALDQEEFRADGTQSTISLLVQTYLSMIEPELDELALTLEKIRQYERNTSSR